MYARSTVLAAILAFSATTVLAHGGSHDAKPSKSTALQSTEEHPFGRAGNPKKVDRTIAIGMNDRMQFVAANGQRTTDVLPGTPPHAMPGDVVIKQGETIRFLVHNEGQVMHEMVIGGMKELKEHSALMRKFPNMEHDEPYMAHVKPGGKEDVVWQFTRAGEFFYACLIPGHFEAGMVAKITVEPRK